MANYSVQYNFHKMDEAKWDPAGEKYDIDSIMQYYGFAFSENGEPSMILKGRV